MLTQQERPRRNKVRPIKRPVVCSPALLLISLLPSSPQGSDGRVGDPEVPPARHPGGPAARAPSHPDQEVPGQRRHSHVVPHLHVGGGVPEVGGAPCWGQMGLNCIQGV